jgi:hypothetical protein
MAKAILELLSKRPGEGYSLSGIADKLKLKHFSRESSSRASLSRCLNNLQRNGMVHYFYGEEGKHLGKYWTMSLEEQKCVSQECLEKNRPHKWFTLRG